jgi:hypothetical protein
MAVLGGVGVAANQARHDGRVHHPQTLGMHYAICGSTTSGWY